MNWRSRKTIAVADAALFVVAAVLNYVFARLDGTHPALFILTAQGMTAVALPFLVIPLYAVGLTFAIQGLRKIKPVEAIGGFALLTAMWITFGALWINADIL